MTFAQNPEREGRTLEARGLAGAVQQGHRPPVLWVCSAHVSWVPGPRSLPCPLPLSIPCSDLSYRLDCLSSKHLPFAAIILFYVYLFTFSRLLSGM